MTQPILHSPDPEKWSLHLLERIELTDIGCWLWTSSLDRWGYGTFSITHNGKKLYTGAHRASWLAHRGDIPDPTLHVDHLCHVRRCVNPDHMQLLAAAVNESQQLPRSVPEGSRTRCSHGRVNGYQVIWNGGRLRWVCRICRSARRAKKFRRRKAARRE